MVYVYAYITNASGGNTESIFSSYVFIELIHRDITATFSVLYHHMVRLDVQVLEHIESKLMFWVTIK